MLEDSKNLARGDKNLPSRGKTKVYRRLISYPQVKRSGREGLPFSGNKKLFPPISGRFNPHTKYGPTHGCREKVS